MSDWSMISWWIGAAMALAGGVVGAMALFRDRSRGRRRCPKCWYDMSGSPSGMTCPECGKTQKREARFFRTRRHWRRLALAAAMVGASLVLAAAPAVFTGKVAKYTPISVLRAGLPYFKESIGDVSRRVRATGSAARLTAWERLLLAQALSRDLRAPDKPGRGWEPPGGRPIPGALQNSATPRRGLGALFLLSSLGDEARPALPEVAHLILKTGSFDFDEALRVTKDLGAAGRPVVKIVRAAAESGDGVEVRKRALCALFEFGVEENRASVRRIATRDQEPAMRLEAAAALLSWDLEHEAALDGLEDALRRGGVVERGQALVLLGRFVKSEYEARILDPKWPTCQREVGSITVSQAGLDERAVLVIGSALTDSDAKLRKLAGNLLAGVGARVTPLGPLLRDRVETEMDAGARWGAIAAYSGAADQDISFLIPELVERARCGDDVMERWTVWILGRCGDRAAPAAWVVREGAMRCVAPWHGTYCEALGAMGAEGRAALNEFMRLGDPLDHAATMHLAHAGVRHRDAARSMLDAAHDPSSRVRENVARYITGALAGPDAPLIMEALDRLATDPVAGVRRVALLSIEPHAGESEAVAALVRGLRDADSDVRDTAARLLLHRATSSDAALAAARRLEDDADVDVRERAGKIVRVTEEERRGR